MLQYLHTTAFSVGAGVIGAPQFGHLRYFSLSFS